MLRQMRAANVMAGTMRAMRPRRQESAPFGKLKPLFTDESDDASRVFASAASGSMSFVEFEHRVLPRILPPLMAGLVFLAALGHNNAQAAADKKSFVISDAEGYGIMECLTNGSSCGRVVADAWCEAHGLGPSLAFGRADDITGAIATSARRTDEISTQVSPGSIVVTCDN